MSMSRKLVRLLSGAFHATLQRLAAPYRGAAPELYRYPWF
jgi:hypothetical protein